MRVLFVQQDHVSPPGPVADAFAARGFDVEEFLVVPEDRFADPGVDVVFPDPERYDAIVPMGAPWSLGAAAIAGWVAPELAMLRAAVAAGVPVLGICFGGQALAAALGGSVQRARETEIGWVEVETDDAALVAPGPWFQWHQDCWTTPPGGREIARTLIAPQAFVLGRALAVQFHPELTPAQLSGWLANGGSRFLAAHRLDAGELEARTRAEEQAARARTRRLVDAFLDHVATAQPAAPPRLGTYGAERWEPTCRTSSASRRR
jgi:GMP synthase-like glutamine amidotransferase